MSACGVCPVVSIKTSYFHAYASLGMNCYLCDIIKNPVNKYFETYPTSPLGEMERSVIGENRMNNTGRKMY